MTATRMTIRLERRADADVIRSLLATAFPTPAEANLVDALREAGHLRVSMVALLGDEVVGHVAFSPVYAASGREGLGLAPLAVAEAVRRRGVGAALVRGGLSACAAHGCGWVVVLGEPEYYGRFGFSPAGQCGLFDEYGGGPAFQAIELVAGELPRGAGLVEYGEEFASL